MRKIILILMLFSLTFAYKVEITKWSYKSTFYGFLKDNSIPLSIYYSLPADVQKKLSRIKVGSIIFLLKNNNKLKQALIPIDDKNQLQIINNNNAYSYRIVPIIYDEKIKTADINIEKYLSYDIFKTTGNRYLTHKLINIFEDKINFHAIPKNTHIKIVYKELLRYGKVKNVQILFASVKNNRYSYNAFYNPYDGRYYDEEAKSIKGMFLSAPLRYKKISSKFGIRFHPIYHKWRMHNGIDYVNKVGTPIHSVADGKVVFKGWIKGYGKSVKIKHKNGYITLYAHLNGWPRRIYVGKWVKQGDVIGYLGNTGLSTGPHLHFGIMHYGKWINPDKIKNSARVTLWGKKRKQFLSYIRQFQKDYNIALK